MRVWSSYHPPRPAVVLVVSTLAKTSSRSTDDNKDTSTEERPASKCRKVEPLRTDDFLAELFFRDALFAELLVQTEPNRLDRDVLLASVLAERPHNPRGEEAASTDSNEEVGS